MGLRKVTQPVSGATGLLMMSFLNLSSEASLISPSLQRHFS